MVFFGKLAVAATVLAVGILAVNGIRVNAAVAGSVGARSNMTVFAYYQMGVVPDSIVYDVWEVGNETSSFSALGSFFRFAEEMRDRDFREVRMANRGKTVFVLGGDDFKMIGESLSVQNPAYLLRTFPEKLELPDGRPAFGTWTGGLIGVANSQLEDLNDLSKQWLIIGR